MFLCCQLPIPNLILLASFPEWTAHVHVFVSCLRLSPEYSISAAAIAIFSVAFMILGTICALAALGKGKDYIYKPAGMFYAFAGKVCFLSPSLLSVWNSVGQENMT